MKKHLIPESGSFYKAGLHIHTNISDGRMSPEEVKSIYKSDGYQIISITDHQILLPHPELDDEDFLTITGAEIAKNKGNYMLEPSTHFNIYAKDPNACTFPYFDPDAFWKAIEHGKDFLPEEAKSFKAVKYGYPPEELNKVIAACSEAGYLITLNHPVDSFQNYAFYGSLRGLWGAEVFNTGCYKAGVYESMQICDDLWREGERRVFPIAADDSHSKDICCGGWVMVKAERLDYAMVFSALERGDFYSSTGVEIRELTLENESLHVELDGADEVRLTTPIRFRKLIKSTGEPITSCDIDLSGFLTLCRDNPDKTKDVYIRFEAKRNDGTLAYTRAYFIEELL